MASKAVATTADRVAADSNAEKVEIAVASKAVMMTADQATADSTVEKVEIAADLKAVAITAIRVAADSIAETMITIQVEIDILRRKENLINAILTPREKSQQLPLERKESA